MENLDLQCAEAGKRIAECSGLEERLLNQGLAVLEEQGVYAFFLYLKAQGKDAGRRVSETCWDFLRNTPSGRALLEGDDKWETLKKLGSDLDALLFARELLRQVLVYARYHIKAKGQE